MVAAVGLGGWDRECPLALGQGAEHHASARRNKVFLIFWSYDYQMRGKTLHILVVATFVALAVTFDYFTVEAVYVAGFEGMARVALAIICLVVGTIAAYVLTATIVRVIANRKSPRPCRARASLAKPPVQDHAVVSLRRPDGQDLLSTMLRKGAHRLVAEALQAELDQHHLSCSESDLTYSVCSD